MWTERFKNVTSFVINLLNNKTINLLNLAEYRLILADSAWPRWLSIRRYSARFRRIIVNYLPPSNSRENGVRFASVTSEAKKSSKIIFCGVYYLTVLVYTKTTIHLSVGG